MIGLYAEKMKDITPEQEKQNSDCIEMCQLMLTFVRSMSSLFSTRDSFLKISTSADITESDTTYVETKTLLDNEKILLVVVVTY